MDEHRPRPDLPFGILAVWRQRIAYRRSLRCMLASNPHLIADIGLTEAIARAEAQRPFWRA